ncbi:MAG: SH3 domain-containing protein [Clostridia bacterium]|nr:SH3 domain-containing protein [Clostridia bacterium]
MTVYKSKLLKRAISFLLAIVVLICPLMLHSAAATAMGDVNGDGNLNSADALSVLQHSVSLITLSADMQKVADVNWDGAINSTDALEILLVVTGIKTSFPEKPTTPETPTDFKPYTGYVTAEPSLRLRSETNTNSTILANIPYTTKLTITNESNGWGKTTYAGQSGWVSLQYISKNPIKQDEPTGKSGTFTITCYGFGHGVGMSQTGAIAYAEQGWTYDKILLHYYHSDKTKIVTDTNMPSTVTFGGATYSLKQYIACATYAETGDYVSYESIKSLMVAIYTFAKYYNFKVPAGTHEFKASYKWEGTAVGRAMNEVLGKYVQFEGKPALTVYCSSVGHKTTSSENAWGYGPSPAYLAGGRESPESDSISKRVYTFTADELKSIIQKNTGVTLTGDPSTWFANVVHDKSVDENTGYISSMKLGSKTYKGDTIRTQVFGASRVRSHCLNIKYNP